MKKNLSRVLCLCLALSMVMAAISGCGISGSDTGGTRTVTDCIGREVEIPEDPQNVACLYATAAHMMLMLDQQEKIVGCPNGVKTDVLMQIKYPEITETATPHQEGSVNAEELLRTDTDLALISASLASSEGEMEKLDELGIAYVVIDYKDVESLRKAISVAGDVFNEEEKADAYLDFFDSTIAMVEERLADVDLAEAPKVFHSVNEATRTDPEGIHMQSDNGAGEGKRYFGRRGDGRHGQERVRDPGGDIPVGPGRFYRQRIIGGGIHIVGQQVVGAYRCRGRSSIYLACRSHQVVPSGIYGSTYGCAFHSHEILSGKVRGHRSGRIYGRILQRIF